MPNNQRPDYVAPHQHAAPDVNGLGVFLFPPTQIAEGVTANPTRSAPIYATLTDMTLDVTPPSWFPLWRATITFTGTFSSDTLGYGAILVPAVDGAEVDETTTARQGVSYANDSVFEVVVQGSTVLHGGEQVTLTMLWGSTDLTATALITAVETYRRMEVVLTPYTLAAP